jgi:hypothetical protein
MVLASPCLVSRWLSWDELRSKGRDALFLPLAHALEDPNFDCQTGLTGK